MKIKKIKVVDLFAGVGGLSYGFAKDKNFEIILANEYNKGIAQAYLLNHPSVNVLDCDIKDITNEQLENIIKEPIDVIIGGPPCQSYSTLGKREMDDRAYLFTEYCRILSILKPKLFIYENVSGLLSMQSGSLIKKIISDFNSLGYEVKHKLLNAVDYGVPQHRKRVFIVGTKGKNNFEYPTQTHSKNDFKQNLFGNVLLPYRTVEDAFSDLPVLKSGEQSSEYAKEPQNDFQRFLRLNSTELVDNVSPKNNENMIKIMQTLPDGGSKNDLPDELKPKNGFGNVYAKMWWKKPAPTITRNFATPSSSRCIHPRDSRAMSTREGARLQSFPDDYKFFGGTQTKNLSIGNAVPPLLSIELAKQVKKYFEKEMA